MTSTAITATKKRKELHHQEGIIDSSLKGFVYIGEALRVIRDEKLWDEDYESFEGYLNDKWHLARVRGYQLMNAAATYTALGKKNLPVLPNIEAHATALSATTEDVDEAAKVWKAALKVAGGVEHMTAKIIKETAESVLGPTLHQSNGKAPKKDAEAKTESVPAKEPEPEDEEPSDSLTAGDLPTFTGRPQHGTSFNPETFDPDVEVASPLAELEAAADETQEADTPVSSNVPKHLIQVIDDTVEGRDIRSLLTQVKRRLHAFAKTQAGSWFNVQEGDRLVDQLDLNLKMNLYACNCPRCKNKPDKKCDRCEGRGWLDRAHMNLNTDADKDWLAKQK